MAFRILLLTQQLLFQPVISLLINELSSGTTHRQKENVLIYIIVFALLPMLCIAVVLTDLLFDFMGEDWTQSKLIYQILGIHLFGQLTLLPTNPILIGLKQFGKMKNLILLSTTTAVTLTLLLAFLRNIEYLALGLALRPAIMYPIHVFFLKTSGISLYRLHFISAISAILVIQIIY